MILSRLTFHLESNHLLSTCQAGFCLSKSSLDQILTLSQSIWDSFQKKKRPDRTILHPLTSPRLSTRSGTLLCFTNSSRSNSPFALFFGYVLSFLIVELKSRLVVPTAVPSASDEGSPRARYLVQSSSSCLLMTSPRIFLGVPMPPCMLTIWHLVLLPRPAQSLFSCPILPHCPKNMVQLMETSSQSKEVRVLLFLYRSPSSHFTAPAEPPGLPSFVQSYP